MACELGQAFARLGVDVTLVEQCDRLLPGEDEDVGLFMRQRLEAEGVTVLCGTRVQRIDGQDGGVLLRSVQGDQWIEIPADRLLLALGRTPRLEGLGLEALGIPVGPALEVDAYLRLRSMPHILACGDVIGPYRFTHVAAHQAWYAAINALLAPWGGFKVDYSVIPRVIFVDPGIARVGLSLAEARAKQTAVDVTRLDIATLDRAIVDGEQAGWIQVLTAAGTDRLVGVTVVSSHAEGLIAEFCLAMRHGLGLNKILATVHAYPTWNEAGKQIAGQWRRMHAPTWLWPWLRRYHAWRRGEQYNQSGGE
jgi:pyruvate/2-oxoglutarate dehydrogenase complex dihydrolipoamide dehydrogenase (E3) component